MSARLDRERLGELIDEQITDWVIDLYSGRQAAGCPYDIDDLILLLDTPETSYCDYIKEALRAPLLAPATFVRMRSDLLKAAMNSQQWRTAARELIEEPVYD